MNADEREFMDKLFEKAVGAAYEVANTLGCGFLEKVYERAMMRELALRGLRVGAQASYSVIYEALVSANILRGAQVRRKFVE